LPVLSHPAWIYSRDQHFHPRSLHQSNFFLPNPSNYFNGQSTSIQGYERKRQDPAHIIMQELRRENGSWAGNVQGKG